MTGSLDELAVRTFAAVDRRQLISVAVDGTGLVRTIELDDRCARQIQPQQLDREIVAVYKAARHQATDAVEQGYAEAGLDLAAVNEALRRMLVSTSGSPDLLAGFESETFRGTNDGQQVVVELDHRGDLSSLDITTRHAATTDPARLSADIRTAFDAARAALQQRLAELAPRGDDDRPLAEALGAHVTAFREQVDDLVGRLPQRSSR